MNYKALDEALEYLNNLEELDEIVIGTIDFDSEEYLDEVKIGDVNFGSTKGTCQIKVLGNEGINYPHFHIESNKGASESVCIAIYVAEYYKHGHGEATLNSKEMKTLLTWLDSNFKKKVLLNIDGKNTLKEITNWEYIAYSYDSYNGTNYFKLDKSKRPEYYANMPDMKDV